MFGRLDALVVEAHACVSGLDAALLTGVDAATALRKFAELEQLGAAGRILLAKRVDETGAWAGSGCRNAAEWMAHQTGTSVGDAQGVLDTSWNLDAQPDVADAVRSGELSTDEASMISRAAKKAPDAERNLVNSATKKKQPLSALRDECNKAKARAEDPAKRAQRCHKARRANFGAEQDGMVPLTTWSPVSVAAKLRAVLEKRTDQMWRAVNKAKTEWEPRDRYMHDAVVDAILGAEAASGAEPKRAKSAARTNVAVRVDLTALRRGWALDDEICDAPGVGEITPREVELLMAENDCFIDALLTRGTDVLKIVRMDRYVPVDVRRSLQMRDAKCVVPGCGQAYRLERDHIEGFAATRRTKLDELALLCPHHHRLKTLHGWVLTRLPNGDWSFDPPNTEGSLFADAQPGASP